MQASSVRTMVRGLYDLQKLRIQMGNRIVVNFKAKLGQAPGEKEEELDDEAKTILADLRARYRKLTDGLKRFPKKEDFKGDEVISSYAELVLLRQYIEMERQETNGFNNLEELLKEFKVYTDFLVHIRGIGPAMAGVIISEIDIHRAKYPSSLWKLSGLDVVAQWKLDRIEPLSGNITEDIMQLIPVTRPMVGDDAKVDGETFVISEDRKTLRVKYQWDDKPDACEAVYQYVEMGGRSKRKEHLIEVEYTNKRGKKAKRMSITFNPFLKTKLVGVLATSFLRVKDSPYAEIYRQYKNRLENHAKYGIANDEARIAEAKSKKAASDGEEGEGGRYSTKAHRHAMAMRYMVKQFLVDLFVAWKKAEGLPVTTPYSEGKLGMKHAG